MRRKEKLRTKPNDKTCMLVTYFSTALPPPPPHTHTHQRSWFHTCPQHKGCNKATTDNIHRAQLLPSDSLQIVYLPSDFPLAVSSGGLLTQLPPFNSLFKWSTCPVTSLWYSSNGLLAQSLPFDSLFKWSTCPVTSLWQSLQNIMVDLPSHFPLTVSSNGLFAQLLPFDGLFKWSLEALH